MIVLVKGWLFDKIGSNLLNVINNSVDKLKTLPIGIKRKVLIEVSFEDGYSIVSIRDSGGGISSEIVEKIFDPYFTTKYKDKGTGIGLYMSKMLLDNMDKEIYVKNTKDGVKFTILG